MLNRSYIRVVLVCLLLVFPLAIGVSAQSKKSNEAESATQAAGILTEIMNIPESSVPDELMARAHGIAVIPHVVKGAFGLGGQWGKGLMSSGMKIAPGAPQTTLRGAAAALV